ncbi:MAG: ribonuclease P protein component [Candidatus Lambdaproteobacteria bacterium]|nr:ribonuclease P protein component [Candidatus Lambdaproteobacteria bacterium]
MTRRLRYPKALRLSTRQDIDAVFRRGRYHRLGNLQGKALRTGGPESRFLISVRKTVGSAPERNRIKRLVREAIRQNRHELQVGFDICLFLTGRPPRPLAYGAIEAEIRQLFQRLKTSSP